MTSASNESERTSGPSIEPAAADPESQQPRRFRWQVGLRTLLLLMAASGVWIAYVNNRAQISQVRKRIEVLRPLHRELRVDDLSKIAVVLLEPTWFDEFRWKLHLPEGKYRLCLATREIPQKDMPPKFAHVTLPAGRHSLELKQIKLQEGARVSVWLDDKELIGVDETEAWRKHDSSMGGPAFSDSTQFPPSEQVILFRRQYSRREPEGNTFRPDAITDGVMIWIEP